jgi:hypothetical protein
MLERRLLWIREFESSRPSQPVRSPRLHWLSPRETPPFQRDLKIKVTLLPVNELAPDWRTVLLTHPCEGQAATVLQPPAQPATAAEVDAQKRVTYVG